jgi:hypothetical protein
MRADKHETHKKIMGYFSNVYGCIPDIARMRSLIMITGTANTKK